MEDYIKYELSEGGAVGDYIKYELSEGGAVSMI